MRGRGRVGTRGALHSMMEELLQYTTLACRPAPLPFIDCSMGFIDICHPFIATSHWRTPTHTMAHTPPPHRQSFSVSTRSTPPFSLPRPGGPADRSHPSATHPLHPACLPAAAAACHCGTNTQTEEQRSHSPGHHPLRRQHRAALHKLPRRNRFLHTRAHSRWVSRLGTRVESKGDAVLR